MSKGSILFRSYVSCVQFVMMVKLFEQETSALVCSRGLDLNRNTARF